MKESPISVGFISLGCSKNLVDSQIMAGALLAAGATFVPDPEKADVIVVNTCAFIEDAREESVETILSVCELKTSGRCKAVLVAGCLPQRYREKLADILPEVDAFIGLDELQDIGNVLDRVLNGANGIVEVSRTSSRLYDPEYPELVLTGGPYAYLKIAEGCNHKCSFCAIPGIRGQRRSRTIESITREAEILLQSGIRELNVISQDVTAYGRDLGDGNDLAALLRVLEGCGNDFWIRLLYGYPAGYSAELLDVIASSNVICRYFDIPIQHSHPDILRAMKRTDTVGKLEGVIERIRETMPDAVLRTTCLVGFPGEEEKHFQHLYDFVQRMKFDHLGVFVYSPEEGTKAFDMKERPDPELCEERRHELMMIQRSIVDGKASSMTGEEVEVLVERKAEQGHFMIGRSRREAPEVDGEIFIKHVAPEDIGNFIRVKYTGQLDYDMSAEKL